ncbi:MAG: DUF2309 domain-containing protein [Verrucomicrobiaceae bacterium]|nr:DUF2309 domain-containing protein [Verrucomicrobiaceae bacterium]
MSATTSNHLQHLLDHAAHYLPAQGPIGVFIHHNTLHAFQSKTFEEAVTEAASIYHTEPYMAEAAYQAELKADRILPDDIRVVVESEPNSSICKGLDRHRLRQVMLLPGVRSIDASTVAWHLEEGDWLTKFRSDVPSTGDDKPTTLWKAIESRLPQPSGSQSYKPARPADAVLSLNGELLDEIVNPALIRLAGAFLDQGVAYWPMPLRELGLYAASRKILSHKRAIFPAHLTGAFEVFLDQERRALSAEQALREQLSELGVSEDEWDGLITAELLGLPGWAGMIHKLENEPNLAPHETVPASLMDYMALRLTFTVIALRNMLGDTKSWRTTPLAKPSEDHRLITAQLFDAAQLAGLSSTRITSLTADEFRSFRDEVLGFDNIQRRRLLHLAYERRHERRILIPLQKHRVDPESAPASDQLAAQVIFCIDEREESIRRALEEVDPQIETHGAAGFFGCAMDYTGIDDAHGVSLCPVVVTPAHQVVEVPAPEHAEVHEKRQLLRRAWAKLAHWDHVSSRSLVRGWVTSTILGFFSAFPLIIRILRPLAWAKLHERLVKLMLPEPKTELSFLREDAEARNAEGTLLAGFSTTEKIDRVAAVLGTAGMLRGHARIVCVLGHGSTSWNNPHESAHDCGACGGRRGGPNARLFAAMANRPEVREGLKSRGIFIPEDTWFIGGYHDTCSDEVELSDLDLVPASHAGILERLRNSLDKARALSAHERARRFEMAASDIDPEEGLKHVQERAAHLAEPRPEYGHCTNAVCIVGRRKFTRGLFFDRRAFLVSYDPTVDPDDGALGRVLGAVIPVCGGISLEYYFSFVDNEGYGCGTKLPHNVTGLIGVMNGFQGDLRTGLPLQMVEIHEPVRILFVIETTPARLMKVIKANPELNEFVSNRWIRVSTMDPDDGHIEVYRDGIFERLEGDEEPLPTAPSSIQFYQGKMEHLPVARIIPSRAA